MGAGVDDARPWDARDAVVGFFRSGQERTEELDLRTVLAPRAGLEPSWS